MVLTQVLTTYYIGIRPLPIRKCMNIVLHVYLKFFLIQQMLNKQGKILTSQKKRPMIMVCITLQTIRGGGALSPPTVPMPMQ